MSTTIRISSHICQAVNLPSRCSGNHENLLCGENGNRTEDIVCVSVMPCTAKKFELQREDQYAAGVPDVDISITTRELARLIRKVGINFRSLPDEGFDDPLGESTGAGVIFGATAVLWKLPSVTAVEELTGETLEKLDFMKFAAQRVSRSNLQCCRHGCEGSCGFRSFQC